MELEIYSPSKDGFVKEITWNHEEIKKEVAEKVKHYSAMVYTEDQIKDAKADRAKLRKFVDALETKRKEIKKQCLAPYEAFEKQMKEITAIVNEPIALIDAQVKEYEEIQKEEKIKAIEAHWHELLRADKIPAGITFSSLYNEKWLNASVKMPDIEKELAAKLEQIEKDLAVIEKLPHFVFEAKEVYYNRLDLSEAVSESYRLQAQAEKKAAWEAEQAKKRAEAEAAAIKPSEPTPAPAEIPCTPYGAEGPQTEPFRKWIGFKAFLSIEEAQALRSFFDERKIEFQAI